MAGSSGNYLAETFLAKTNSGRIDNLFVALLRHIRKDYYEVELFNVDLQYPFGVMRH